MDFLRCALSNKQNPTQHIIAATLYILPVRIGAIPQKKIKIHTRVCKNFSGFNFPLCCDKRTLQMFYSGITPQDLDRINKKGVDTLLAEELNQLSMEEREKACFDIHGVSDPVKETPNFVRERLAQLERELAGIEKKQAFDTAARHNLSMVANPQFRLKFLRAESFVVERAAQRLVAFWEAKLELFGADKLTRDILLSDLQSPNDLAVIESGLFQLLPLRDRAGRAVLCHLPMLPTVESEILSKVRNAHILHFSREKMKGTRHCGAHEQLPSLR